MADISRRSFFRGLAVAGAAGVVGYVVARTTDLGKAKPAAASNPYGYGATTTSPTTGGTAERGRFLTELSAVPPVGGGLILASQAVVVVRETGGAVKGFSAICTHEGCTVGTVQGGIISCPCHGSEFSAVTGAVVQGPAARPLPSVDVAVRHGAVYLV
ncbi:MAG TPA: Rieske (2Fe-2S) protein [Acidimicrobiales bacterium]|nr:Rieske (2Fe-2S) protein [Acidimicrobiales bacterium]